MSNFGRLTAVQTGEGFHYHNPCGLTVNSVSVAQVAIDLENQRVLDKDGNPLVVSAVLQFRYVDAVKATFNVKNAGSFIIQNASASLKNVLSHYTYDELKLEQDEVNKK